MHAAVRGMIAPSRRRRPTQPAPGILVVDDDPVALAITTSALQHYGFTVFAATTAIDAFLQIEREPAIALTVIDIVLPGIDGLMLADMIKVRHRDMRIIYATGFPEVVAQQPGYRYGPVLAKPVEPSALETAVRAALARPPDRFGHRPRDEQPH